MRKTCSLWKSHFMNIYYSKNKYYSLTLYTNVYICIVYTCLNTSKSSGFYFLTDENELL